MPPMNVHDLPTPCLVLDLDRLTANCERMRAIAQRAGVRLRPHLKTLKSLEAARLAMDGRAAITVSTLNEAAWFAERGIQDITCAVCLPPGKVARAAQIHQGMAGPGLGILLDDPQAARAAIDILRGLGARLPVWIEVDCGEHRTGVDPDGEALLTLARLLHEAPETELRGVLTHGGQSYRCRSVAEVQAVAETERERVVHAATRLREAGLPCPGVSAGSTPTAVHGQRWDGVTELRPGVYMAGDLFQVQMQSMAREDLALSVLSSVISSHPDRAVIDAGGLALSKDRSMRDLPQDPGYGEVLDAGGRPLGLAVGDVHQEHGEIRLSAQAPALPVGTRLRVWPNHVCMTAAAHPRYHVLRGEAVVAVWERTNGWD
jgi:D-serine deaminase-like pyridoxal phosphate-dependent protein